jgi:formylglycine-generating enzyme required for sulfatase activity
VGSESPLGDGRYGQADLAGNLREWTQDWFFPHNQSNDPVYSSTTCVNCAELTLYGDRIFWGGSFVDDLGQGFQFRAGSGPYYGSPLVGARCARMP